MYLPELKELNVKGLLEKAQVGTPDTRKYLAIRPADAAVCVMLW